MKQLDNIKNVYFLGIGGIGMSALARYFKFTGRNVAGYDRTQTPLTDALAKEGIDIHYDDDIRKIPSRWNPAETMAIFTPALPDDHNELSWFRERPIGLFKRARVLGMISNEKSGIAVAGTHGKTTVSTMVANILNHTPQGCGAFLGGISGNFGSNLLLPKEESPWIVVEADEFDRSFLHLHPQLALVTSIDADHLDIYGDKQHIIESFADFVSQIKPDGALVIREGIGFDAAAATSARVYTYSLRGKTDFRTRSLSYDKAAGVYRFDFQTPGGTLAHCSIRYPGLINVENAVAAGAMAFLAGAPWDAIKKGFAGYQGVARRFDIRLQNDKCVYIDDYAHHPEEIKAVITSVRDLFPGRKVTGIFQPHLYSRTKDFSAEFARSLDMLDQAVLIPLYPAREEPVKGVSSELIYDQMELEDKYLLEKEETLEFLERSPKDIIITMGAGDIDRMVPQIIQLLEKSN